MQTKWKSRISEIEVMLLDGKTYREIGEYFGTSSQWIQQLSRRHLSHISKQDKGVSKRAGLALQAKFDRVKLLYNRDTLRPSNDLEKAQSAYFTRKKQNSRHSKWEFTIKMSDLDWPTHCPILGLELDWFAEYRQENSPSIDRINSREGYVPGNVMLVSWRANRIKNDGSANEHRLIAEYMERGPKPS